MHRIPMSSLHLKHERYITYDEQVVIKEPEDVFALMAPIYNNIAVERVYIISLSSADRVIGIHLISEGSLNGAELDIPKIARLALLSNAYSIIITHNHPSGEKRASAEDVIATKHICDAMNLLNIPVKDHVICTLDDMWSWDRNNKSRKRHG